MNVSSERIAPDLCRDRGVDAISPANCAGARLLIVDDEPAHRNVLAVMLEQAGMACLTAPSAKDALDILQKEPIDAVISDLNMPGASGMELLEEIRLHHPHLVFLMVTGIGDVQLGVRAMRQGADDYLTKPLQMDAVLVSLERAFRKQYLEQKAEHYRHDLEKMVYERTVRLRSALGQIEQGYADTLDALGAAIDLRDGQTAGHSRRVVLYSTNILKRMNGTPQQLKSLAMGAWLHDIGKLAISDTILLKPAALTENERRILREHVRIGYDLVKRIQFLAGAAEIILNHHERWDGSGYPRGLKGFNIPLNARIFSVADTVDAMTSDRPYRSALPFQAARNEIERKAGIQFDSQVAEVFLRVPNETWEAIRKQASAINFSTALAGMVLDNLGDCAECGRAPAE
jgi:response regulator RpfG family c-di-GMP phosphodiesterase